MMPRFSFWSLLIFNFIITSAKFDIDLQLARPAMPQNMNRHSQRPSRVEPLIERAPTATKGRIKTCSRIAASTLASDRAYGSGCPQWGQVWASGLIALRQELQRTMIGVS